MLDCLLFGGTINTCLRDAVNIPQVLTTRKEEEMSNIKSVVKTNPKVTEKAEQATAGYIDMDGEGNHA